MSILILVVILGSAVCVHSVGQGHNVRATPVHGYAAVRSALEAGKSLHFYVTLSQCQQDFGPSNPELTAPFGGNVDYFRSFTGPFSNTHFMETRLMMNSTGRWVRVSRRIELEPNNTARVHSYIFTPDFFFMTYEYSHVCMLESPLGAGAIQFYEGGLMTPVTSFATLTSNLRMGDYLHFDINVASCTVSPPSPFPQTSNLGAHIREFDIRSTGGTEMIEATIQPTVGYSRDHDYQLHLHNMRVYSDGNVYFRRTAVSPPDLRPTAEETYMCKMATSTGGGAMFYTSM